MLLLKGVIMILLAILTFMSPGGALLTYAIFIGIGFTLAGIVRIIQGFQAKGIVDNWGWIVLEGSLVTIYYRLLGHLLWILSYCGCFFRRRKFLYENNSGNTHCYSRIYNYVQPGCDGSDHCCMDRNIIVNRWYLQCNSFL